MKRSGVPILIVGIAAALLLAGDQPHRLVLPASGFSIAVLDCPPGDQVCQPLMMFLPPSDAFAPNVNVPLGAPPTPAVVLA